MKVKVRYIKNGEERIMDERYAKILQKAKRVVILPLDGGFRQTSFERSILPKSAPPSASINQAASSAATNADDEVETKPEVSIVSSEAEESKTEVVSSAETKPASGSSWGTASANSTAEVKLSSKKESSKKQSSKKDQAQADSK